MDRAAQLVTAVRQAASLPTDEDAERALRATLRVLGERLGAARTRTLSSRLPRGFCGILPPHGDGSTFDLEEFYERVARYESRHTSPTQARRDARAVFTAIGGMVDRAVLIEIAAQLPAEFTEVLGVGQVRY